MFGQPEGPHPDRRDVQSQAIRAAWRGRIAAVLVVAIVAGLIGGALALDLAWSRALSGACDEWAAVDITIDHLIDLKQRKNAYQASMQSDAYLQMTAEEVNFILRDTLDYELLVSFEGDVVDARIAAPTETGCYNIAYRGRVDVADGVARFEPERLVVGELDLTGIVAGRRFTLTAGDVDGWLDPRVVRSLRNTDHIEFKDSVVRIQLVDRWKMW